MGQTTHLDLAAATLRPMSAITLLGARGGVGTSTLTLEIARQLVKAGKQIEVIDSDPWDEVITDAGDFRSQTPDHTLVASHRFELPTNTDHILLLVPCEIRAIATAAQLVPMLEREALVSLVVRTPGPTRIKATKVSDLLQLPLAAAMEHDSKLALLGEHGLASTRSLQQSAKQVIEYLDLE